MVFSQKMTRVLGRGSIKMLGASHSLRLQFKLNNFIQSLYVPNNGSKLKTTPQFIGSTTLQINERVTKIEAWFSSDLNWYRIKFTLNTGVLWEHNANPPAGTTSTLHTFDVPVGQVFIGFTIAGATSGCTVLGLSVKTRGCAVVFNLTSFSGLSQRIFYGTTFTATFIATANSLCTSTIEYEVLYSPSPASGTTGLITQSGTSTTNSIVFAPSTNILDATTYSVSVKARVFGASDWLKPAGQATASYTYLHPCVNTSLIAPTSLPATISTSVLLQVTPGGAPDWKTQSTSATNSVAVAQQDANFCGGYQCLLALF